MLCFANGCVQTVPGDRVAPARETRAGCIVKLSMFSTYRMPYSKKWNQILSSSLGEERAAILIDDANQRYRDYCQSPSKYKGKSEWSAIKKRVYPGLSLYKALRNHGFNQRSSLQMIDSAFRESLFPSTRLGLRLLNVFPNPFVLIRPYLRRMIKKNYTPDIYEFKTDNSQMFFVEFYECAILHTLHTHGAAELTPLYCQTDNWLSNEKPKITFDRAHLLSEGDDRCSFCWSLNISGA